ncbi:hypothetical protein ABID52_000649 [Fictibacillus halophilus]|uniref:Uncharacterized protein n=1 Tax=Fictibacillus halophilus TaxID=1610490 RepID=A0ABV2LHW5_9BACL
MFKNFLFFYKVATFADIKRLTLTVGIRYKKDLIIIPSNLL